MCVLCLCSVYVMCMLCSCSKSLLIEMKHKFDKLFVWNDNRYRHSLRWAEMQDMYCGFDPKLYAYEFIKYKRFKSDTKWGEYELPVSKRGEVEAWKKEFNNVLKPLNLNTNIRLNSRSNNNNNSGNSDNENNTNDNYNYTDYSNNSNNDSQNDIDDDNEDTDNHNVDGYDVKIIDNKFYCGWDVDNRLVCCVCAMYVLCVLYCAVVYPLFTLYDRTIEIMSVQDLQKYVAKLENGDYHEARNYWHVKLVEYNENGHKRAEDDTPGLNGFIDRFPYSDSDTDMAKDHGDGMSINNNSNINNNNNNNSDSHIIINSGSNSNLNNNNNSNSNSSSGSNINNNNNDLTEYVELGPLILHRDCSVCELCDRNKVCIGDIRTISDDEYLVIGFEESSNKWLLGEYTEGMGLYGENRPTVDSRLKESAIINFGTLSARNAIGHYASDVYMDSIIRDKTGALCKIVKIDNNGWLVQYHQNMRMRNRINKNEYGNTLLIKLGALCPHIPFDTEIDYTNKVVGCHIVDVNDVLTTGKDEEIVIKGNIPDSDKYLVCPNDHTSVYNGKLAHWQIWTFAELSVCLFKHKWKQQYHNLIKNGNNSNDRNSNMNSNMNSDMNSNTNSDTDIQIDNDININTNNNNNNNSNHNPQPTTANNNNQQQTASADNNQQSTIVTNNNHATGNSNDNNDNSGAIGNEHNGESETFSFRENNSVNNVDSIVTESKENLNVTNTKQKDTDSENVMISSDNSNTNNDNTNSSEEKHSENVVISPNKRQNEGKHNNKQRSNITSKSINPDSHINNSNVSKSAKHSQNTSKNKSKSTEKRSINKTTNRVEINLLSQASQPTNNPNENNNNENESNSSNNESKPLWPDTFWDMQDEMYTPIMEPEPSVINWAEFDCSFDVALLPSLVKDAARLEANFDLDVTLATKYPNILMADKWWFAMLSGAYETILGDGWERARPYHMKNIDLTKNNNDWEVIIAVWFTQLTRMSHILDRSFFEQWDHIEHVYSVYLEKLGHWNQNNPGDCEFIVREAIANWQREQLCVMSVPWCICTFVFILCL